MVVHSKKALSPPVRFIRCIPQRLASKSSLESTESTVPTVTIQKQRQVSSSKRHCHVHFSDNRNNNNNNTGKVQVNVTYIPCKEELNVHELYYSREEIRQMTRRAKKSAKHVKRLLFACCSSSSTTGDDTLTTASPADWV